MSDFFTESQLPSSLELEKVLTYLAAFAVSEAGQTAALQLRPLQSHAEIRRESLLFEEGILWASHNNVQLTAFPPLEEVLSFVSSAHAVLDIDGLWALRQTLRQAYNCITLFFESRENAPWPLWVKRCQEMVLPTRAMTALDRCLADDGRLKDAASPELSLVRGELRRLHQQCTRKVKEFAVEYNILHFLQDEFMTLSSDRYVLPLKANFKGRLQGIIHDYSQTGETCYFEPLFLVEVNNRLQELKKEEREEERKVFIYLSGLIRDEILGIRSAYSFLVDLDLLFAKKTLADCYDGRIVRMEKESEVFLLEAKHPLLALSSNKDAVSACDLFLRRQAVLSGDMDSLTAIPPSKKQDVIPSTIELHKDQKALVISGGNAGGKTVCLKTLGLAAAMTLCALPVPVKAGSILPEWSKVYAFIGDEQSLDEHVSTFTAQITQLSRIWASLDSSCLVILDEFGAGTDPSQGAALAQAVVDCIIEKDAYTVVATHFPALKAYALSTKGVRAASVLFDPKTKKPLFRLVYDQVGASQALDVAREYGLPEHIVKKAEGYLLVSGEDTTELVARLNSLAVAREEELKALDEEKNRYRVKKARLEEKLAKDREKLFSDIQKEAQGVLKAWKEGKATHKQTLKELSRVRTELAKQNTQGISFTAPENTLPPLSFDSLQMGQILTHTPWKRVGKLVEVDNRKKRVRLDLDGLTLWAEAADVTDTPLEKVLSLLAPSRPGQKGRLSLPLAPQEKTTKITPGSSDSLPLHLDLRGLRADVAINELEKFLDTAILRGRLVIEVVHGRGTGALRREIHGFLKKSSVINRFYLAPEDQGGDGKTVVELK